MLHYTRIDLSEGIYITITIKEYIVCHYWYFNHGFKFQNSVCNGCHDLTMLCQNLSDVAIITVKDVHYRCVIHYISQYEAIHLLKNFVIDDRRYM